MKRRDILKMGALLPIAPLAKLGNDSAVSDVKTVPTPYEPSEYELDLERLVEMIRAEGVPCKIVDASDEPF